MITSSSKCLLVVNNSLVNVLSKLLLAVNVYSYQGIILVSLLVRLLIYF